MEISKSFRFQATWAVLTYASDFNKQINLEIIKQFYNKIPHLNWVAVLSHGDKEIEHDHFHLFTHWLKKPDIKNEKFFDLPLAHPVPSEIDPEKMVLSAHPNISPKQKWGKVIFMMDYVLDQAIEIKSNFDYAKLRVELRKDFEKQDIQQEKKKTNKVIRELFVDYILNNTHLTPKELIKKINQIPDFKYIMASAFINWTSYIHAMCNPEIPIELPETNYDYTFWLPVDLYNYLKQLDKWVEQWYVNGNKPLKRKRGIKSLILLGGTNTGKTSLIACMGEFSYFCNMWNVHNYHEELPFNVFDDIETVYNTTSDFGIMKGWIGRQKYITVTDKYVKKETILNNFKPTIFINNADFTELFVNDGVADYVRNNSIIVSLSKFDNLYTPKNRQTIGGYAKWRKFDPKNTWYYQNIVTKKYAKDFYKDSEKRKEEINKMCIETRLERKHSM